jgi:hypothetical protein
MSVLFESFDCASQHFTAIGLAEPGGDARPCQLDTIAPSDCSLRGCRFRQSGAQLTRSIVVTGKPSPQESIDPKQR